MLVGPHWNLNNNGPFNINANYDPGNRKFCCTLKRSNNLIPNIGVRSVNSSNRLRLFHGDRLYSELYHKAYTTVLMTYKTVSKFPKSQRSVLSARIENTTLEILELVIELECKDSKIHRRKILNELQKLQTLLSFVKHELHARYYIRYVDDFIILHESIHVLEEYNEKINEFLSARLDIQLHPEKSNIVPLHKGVRLLGFRCFYHFRIPKKSNIKCMERKIEEFRSELEKEKITAEEIDESIYGWCAFAMLGSTYRLRKKIWKKAHKVIRDQFEKDNQKEAGGTNRVVLPPN